MRADRLLELMLLLQTRGKMTAARLAKELEVSRRTILRDVEALSLAGVPIYTDGGHGGGISLDEYYRTNLTGLLEDEARTLFVTGDGKVLQALQLQEAAERSRLKLSAALPAHHQQAVQQFRQRILIDPSWWWQDSRPPDFWDELLQAVYEDRVIDAVYERHSGEIVNRVLEPYSLVAKSSNWYLVARRAGEYRTYRVIRFHYIAMQEQHFRREPDFDLPAYWRDHLDEFVATLSEYTVTLRIPPDRMPFVQWLMPGRYQVVESSPDGAWRTVRFQLESMDLAKMLVFGLGAQAQVVEPPELREAVLQTARAICAGEASRAPGATSPPDTRESAE